MAAQAMRELIGASIEFPIGEALLLEHRRDCVRGAGDLGGEQLRQGGGRNRMRGVVPLRENAAALLRRQDVEPADRLIGRRDRRRDEAHEPPRHRLDAGAIE